MKTNFIFLSIFFSISALAGNGSGNVSNVVGVGAMGITSGGPSSFLSIPAGVSVFSLYSADGGTTATSNRFYRFLKNGVGYQVTSGKTAYCFNITAASQPSGSALWGLVSATSAITDGDSSLTGGVYQSGAANKTIMITGGTQSNPWQIYGGMYQFAASTYAGYQASNTQGYYIHMDCYEN